MKNWYKYILSVMLLSVSVSHTSAGIKETNTSGTLNNTSAPADSFNETDYNINDSDQGIYVPFRIKSNLLYDAALMPSVEIEYLFSKRWSAGVETSMAWWKNDNKHQFYQMATLIPELRYNLYTTRKGHTHTMGVFGGYAWYDLENKKTGYQGEGWTAGISYSYSFPVSRLIGFEAGIGVGFVRAKYEEYLPVDGHYVYQQTNKTDYLGPVRLKFALTFDLNRYFEKGGER